MSLHGLLLVNKPSDITSHDVVARVRKILKISSVGHAGTLDPMATGLMVLLIGEGTKLSDYILSGDKSYRLKVQLGLRTDTLDITGEVLNESRVELDPDQIAFTARNLTGEFEWPVPIFSAVKVAGKKLYAYAHRSQTPEVVPMKDMKFWDFSVLSAGSDFIEGHIYCSKGSYIRSWAAQLGEQLKVGGALASLERTTSAPYKLESALTLDDLMNPTVRDSEVWQRAFIPIEKALTNWPAVTIKGKDERLIHNGQVSYDLERRLIVEVKAATEKQEPIIIRLISGETGQLLALLEAVPNKGLKVKRVFRF